LLPDAGRGSPVKSDKLQPSGFTQNALTDSQRAMRMTGSSNSSKPAATPQTPATRLETSPILPTLESADEEAEPEMAVDDGTKPAYSYATLIGMSILRAPEQRLTLSAIYAWISHTFSYYSTSDAGWQNSIRHNLSLNKAFVKVERPKDEPGKGHYWTIEPGCEDQFKKTRGGKKVLIPIPRNNPAISQPIVASSATKKESKKRHVDFEGDAPISKRSQKAANASRPPSANGAPVSPPPTDARRKQNSIWDYDDSGYFSPSGETVKDDAGELFDGAHAKDIYARAMSYSATALDLVLSPPPSSPQRKLQRPSSHNNTLLTPAATKKSLLASPGTSLREHRQTMLRLLASPDTEAFQHDLDDDPWLTNTPKPKEKVSVRMDSHWDDLAERAAFGSPDKRASRRRESRRSLVCGLHAQELYEVGFESSNMPGVDIMGIMKREVDRVKTRPSLMERSQSSLF
jgi:hypothetical protein